MHSGLPGAITPWVCAQCWKDIYCCWDMLPNTQWTTRWGCVMALSALICCDLGDLAGFSLLGRVAMLAKCHTPHYFVTSLPPSDILLLSRPDQAWSSLKSPLDIAQINAPSQLLSPTSPVPPSYHTIFSYSLILLGRNLTFISLPTLVQVWRRPHRKPVHHWREIFPTPGQRQSSTCTVGWRSWPGNCPEPGLFVGYF